MDSIVISLECHCTFMLFVLEILKAQSYFDVCFNRSLEGTSEFIAGCVHSYLLMLETMTQICCPGNRIFVDLASKLQKIMCVCMCEESFLSVRNFIKMVTPYDQCISAKKIEGGGVIYVLLWENCKMFLDIQCLTFLELFFFSPV